MKKVILSISLFILALSLGACAAKVHKKSDDGYYDRANKAAEKAHDKFDRE
jgi:hypothetical protein